MQKQKLLLSLAAAAAALALLAACSSSSTAAPASSAASQPASAADSAPASVADSAADSTAAEPVGAVRLPIPADFLPSEMDGVDEYYCREDDGSNINMVTTEKDDSISLATSDMLLSLVQSSYDEQLGEGVVQVEVLDFSGDDILGCPGYTVSFKVSAGDMTFYQVQMGVSASEACYMWTLTDTTPDNSHAAEFADCLANVYAEG